MKIDVTSRKALQKSSLHIRFLDTISPSRIRHSDDFLTHKAISDGKAYNSQLGAGWIGDLDDCSEDGTLD
jgi:hypothetical protein